MLIRTLMKKLDKLITKQKHEQELLGLIDTITRLNVIIGNEGVTRYCVFVKPDADIYHVQEIFAKYDVKMNKHYIKQGKEQKDILYINVIDFAKLKKKSQKFFNDLSNKIETLKN